jgi:hypothetical protein
MDLAGVSVVDNHCHSLLREPVRDRGAFRLLFAEASTPTFAAFVRGMAYYQAALVALADELGVSADEDAVVEARAAQDHEAWIARLLRSANLHALLVDDGVPPPALSYTRVQLARLAGCAVGHIWRLETAAQELILAHDRFEDLLDGWRAGLQDLRGRGVVALKSIAAYRTGLDVAPPHEAGARAGFAALRRVAERDGRVRLADKPLLDYLLHEALASASQQGVPIQFHTGYGDPDTDLRLGNPLHLRLVFEEPRYQGAPVVLLHESFPYTREAAYLAAVYSHVYADLSYAVPPIGRAELLAMTRAALAGAPTSKLLYSSDGHSIPEHAWLGARCGREIVAAVLQEMVAARELRPGMAEDAGAGLLRENARRLYRLDDVVLTQPPNG